MGSGQQDACSPLYSFFLFCCFFLFFFWGGGKSEAVIATSDGNGVKGSMVGRKEGSPQVDN